MLVKSDEPLLVHGEVRLNQRDEDHPSAEIVASEIELLSQVRNQKTSEVVLRLDAERLKADTVAQLRTLLGRHGGSCSVSVRAVIPERSETRLKVKEKVAPSDDFIEAARRLGFEVELR
jgi:DNA polymerase-3 subunit alpha